MEITAWLTSILSNVWTYIIIIAMAVSGVGMRYMRRVNLNRRRLMVLGAIGILFASGLVSMGMFGVGSTGGTITGAGVNIDRIQTVTAFDFSGTLGSISDSGTDDQRMSDFYITENNVTGDAGNIQSGVFLLTRSGDLTATSCKVAVQKPPRFDISDTTYHLIVEDTNTGVMTAHVRATSDSGTASRATHPKESTMLPFAEGVATGYVSFNITLDETGFDELTQYDYKDINVDMCGYPYTFRLHKADS